MKLLQSFPGIGVRSAERLAFHILKEQKKFSVELAEAITEARAKVHHCRQCFNLTEDPLCSICSDKGRDHSTLCVVESPRELLAMEQSRAFQGLYHCLLGRLAPSEGIHEKNLTIQALVKRCEQEPVKEVILATNPDLGGDATALAVMRALAETNVQISRLGRGLPIGYQLEFLSGNVLEESLASRKHVTTPQGTKKSSP